MGKNGCAARQNAPNPWREPAECLRKGRKVCRVFLYGAYGVTVNTGACGALDTGSIPVRHPIMNFLSYCESLTPEDWKKLVNETWTVRDVIAHIVGWEKEAYYELLKAWQSKKEPWFLTTEDYSDFNRRSVEEYKSFSPRQLLQEWRTWQEKLDKAIFAIGESNLRSEPELFSWVFDEGEGSHYKHHFEQIRRAVE